MARALRAVLDPGHLTVVVNVGDDAERYGVHVAADPDTVLYTLAGVVGPNGWGRRGDTTEVMHALSGLGIDTAFTLGDADLAMCLLRTELLSAGVPLSVVTSEMSERLGVADVAVVPVTDDPLRTWVQIRDGSWLSFQEYFVDRGHADEVTALAYHGAPVATPAPGVIDAITSADTLVIAPSNPPLSIWPILSIDDVRLAVADHPVTIAVSPLFGGRALKGPAAEVMAAVGLSKGTRGVLEAYDGLIDTLYVDAGDAGDVSLGDEFGVSVVAADTRLDRPDSGAGFAWRVVAGAPPGNDPDRGSGASRG
jgi:LPPG:FO 2-phospho-L-lactate transferase